jgi:hypothetical protein
MGGFMIHRYISWGNHRFYWLSKYLNLLFPRTGG